MGILWQVGTQRRTKLRLLDYQEFIILHVYFHNIQTMSDYCYTNSDHLKKNKKEKETNI